MKQVSPGNRTGSDREYLIYRMVITIAFIPGVGGGWRRKSWRHGFTLQLSTFLLITSHPQNLIRQQVNLTSVFTILFGSDEDLLVKLPSFPAGPVAVSLARKLLFSKKRAHFSHRAWKR